VKAIIFLTARFVFYLAIIILSAWDSILAQTQTTLLSDSLTDKSEGRIGIRYTSDYIFMGRADSTQVPYPI
jgi:hypothetical protein